MWDAISAISIFLTLVLGLWTYVLDRRQRETDTLRADAKKKAEAEIARQFAEVNESIRQAKAEQKTRIEEAVEVRFSSLSADFKVAAAKFETLLGSLQERIKVGDAEFKEDDKARHQLEVKLVTQIAQQCATKDDMHRVEERMGALERSVTRFMANARYAGKDE